VDRAPDFKQLFEGGGVRWDQRASAKELVEQSSQRPTVETGGGADVDRVNLSAQNFWGGVCGVDGLYDFTNHARVPEVGHLPVPVVSVEDKTGGPDVEVNNVLLMDPENRVSKGLRDSCHLFLRQRLFREDESVQRLRIAPEDFDVSIVDTR